MLFLLPFLLNSCRSINSFDANKPSPFGWTMGMKEDEIKEKLVKISPFIFETESAPSEKLSFKKYRLLIHPKTGLCRIVAIGKDIRPSKNGDDLIQEFLKIKEQIDQKYGKDEVNQYEEYSNYKKLNALWRNENTKKMGDIIEIILATSSGFSPTGGNIILFYTFKNSKQYDELTKFEKQSFDTL